SKLNVVRDGTRFLYTIIWTAMNYNPVRILGGISLGMAAIAGLIAAIVVGMRISGINQLGPWGVVGVFVAGICAVSGVTLFSLGATFNYLVSLFHKQPIQQGLFGKPIFTPPLDRQFGWMGLVAMGLGLVVGLASLSLSLGGWPMDRLWFWLLAAAMLLVIGLQLTVFWLIMRVLDELSQREIQVARDMEGVCG
ncbi:MAG: glycosyltransferase family 2 protein, partial [Anaerolineae bacterium]